MQYKALIVDDERLARRELRTLLAAHPEISIVGEASTADEAAKAIERTSPDVVFLDIHMPGESGFDLIHRTNQLPHIIFVTAYDAHAVQAFDVEASDYLLKPVRPERLAQAIARLPAHEPTHQQEPRIYLSDRGRMYLVSLSDIVHISGANDYTQVASEAHGTVLDARTLGTWESILPGERFVRIHRSTIVNLDHVDRIVRDANSAYLVYLNHETQAPLKMSRRYAARIKEQFRSFTSSHIPD